MFRSPSPDASLASLAATVVWPRLRSANPTTHPVNRFEKQVTAMVPAGRSRYAMNSRAASILCVNSAYP